MELECRHRLATDSRRGVRMPMIDGAAARACQRRDGGAGNGCAARTRSKLLFRYSGGAVFEGRNEPSAGGRKVCVFFREPAYVLDAAFDSGYYAIQEF